MSIYSCEKSFDLPSYSDDWWWIQVSAWWWIYRSWDYRRSAHMLCPFARIYMNRALSSGILRYWIENLSLTYIRNDTKRTSSSKTPLQPPPVSFMMTSSNGDIFCVTAHLCGEFTGHRWIPSTKVSDAELWCFLWCAPEWTVEWTIVMLVILDAITPIMTSQ